MAASSPAKRAPAKRTAAKKAAGKKAAPDGLSPAPVSAADQELAAAVPLELRFTTTAGAGREPEKMTIALDGMPFTLTQPSNAFLALIMGSFAADARDDERIRAMFQLLRVCLDGAGVAYLDEMIRQPSNTFKDALIGELVGTIIQKWAPELAKDANLDTTG